MKWIIATCAIVMLGLCIGSTGFQTDTHLLLNIRLPVVWLAWLTGAALAVSGLVMQMVLQNPLADPYVIGVSGGAAVGGVLSIVLGLSGVGLPLGAGVGALASMVLLLVLCRSYSVRDPSTLVLVGVVLNCMTSAIVTMLKMLAPASQAQAMLFWLVGGIGQESWWVLGSLGFIVLLSVAVLTRAQPVLRLLSLGTTQAELLGLSAHRARMILLIIASLLCAILVAYTGLVGFVGLIVPNVMRRKLGNFHPWLFVCTAHGGGLLLILADSLGRASFPWFGSQIPVGAITALAGGPFFLSLLRERRNVHP